MNCPNCKEELSGVCEEAGLLLFDREEVTLIRDMMVNEWIQRDHPYYHKAKGMFHKMYTFLGDKPL